MQSLSKRGFTCLMVCEMELFSLYCMHQIICRRNLSEEKTPLLKMGVKSAFEMQIFHAKSGTRSSGWVIFA